MNIQISEKPTMIGPRHIIAEGFASLTEAKCHLETISPNAYVMDDDLYENCADAISADGYRVFTIQPQDFLVKY